MRTRLNLAVLETVSREEQALEMIEGYTLLIDPLIKNYDFGRGILPSPSSKANLYRILHRLDNNISTLYHLREKKKKNRIEIPGEVVSAYVHFKDKLFYDTGVLENISIPIAEPEENPPIRKDLISALISRLSKSKAESSK